MSQPPVVRTRVSGKGSKPKGAPSFFSNGQSQEEDTSSNVSVDVLHVELEKITTQLQKVTKAATNATQTSPQDSAE